MSLPEQKEAAKEGERDKANMRKQRDRERQERARRNKDGVRRLLEEGERIFYAWDEDDIALRAAAVNSRLPFEKLTTQELAAFSDIFAQNSKASEALYLYIRNKILRMWLLEPHIELTKEAVYNDIPQPYNSDLTLVRRIHGFLERFGYINYGIFLEMAPMPNVKRKIIVIGAGASGMTATRQLKRFGFEVVLLEGRSRKGGRIHLHKCVRTKVSVDLGAAIVVGIDGNPLVTLARQKPIHLMKLNSSCTLYDQKGKPVDKDKDNLVENAFNRIIDIASYAVHAKGVDSIDGEKMSLQTAFDHIICLMELRNQRRRLAYWENYEAILNKLKKIQDEMLIAKASGDEIAEALVELREAESSITGEIYYRTLRRDLAAVIRVYEELNIRRQNIEAALNSLRKDEPQVFEWKECDEEKRHHRKGRCYSEVFMRTTDRRILDFHFANLEYANGTQLKNLSLKYWDQDDAHEFTGSHTIVKEGMGSLFNDMVDDNAILFNKAVERIEYSENGVKVTAVDAVTEEKSEVHGDAVLVTVPLGVLKKSVQNLPVAPIFEPPLPAEKVAAIERVGFGNLNKVVLVFKEVFWEKSTHFFGNISHDNVSRGEFYMFMTPSHAPVVTALLAGEAANHQVYTQVEKELLVQKAMAILHRIFGEAAPESPLEAVVTMWHRDSFSFGCYSHMGKDAEAEDYDRLAAPVQSLNEKGKQVGDGRVFFAGEHTSKNYPATVHGAMLSGLREAGRIADVFSGVPYAPPDRFIIDVDEDESTDSDAEEEKDVKAVSEKNIQAEENGKHGKGSNADEVTEFPREEEKPKLEEATGAEDDGGGGEQVIKGVMGNIEVLDEAYDEGVRDLVIEEIDEEGIESVEEGASRRVEEVASRRVEEVASRRVEEEASGRVEEGASGRVEEGASRRVEEGASRRVEEGASRRVEEQAIGVVPEIVLEDDDDEAERE